MCNIFIDADSAGNIRSVESVAKKYGIPVILYCNGDHLMSTEYSEVRYVEKGKDIADFAIVSHCTKGDIVITRDYGLASMALAKNSICLTPNGAEYTADNIDQLLYKRHIAKGRNRRNRNRTTTPIPIPHFHSIGIKNALEKKIHTKESYIA